MKNFNFLFKWTLTVLVASMTMIACNKDMQDEVNDLKDRVVTLEESVGMLKQAIASGKLITAVDPVAATSASPGGWKITFSDKTTMTVNHGNQGDQGIQGVPGQTPYMWINSIGNWATNLGAKPADSDNLTYELKVDGQSVKAQGQSIRVVNQGGYVAFQTFDAATDVVIATTPTNFPFNGGKIITAIRETDETITFTIDSEDYTLAKPAVYPESITVIRDKDYVIKGGTVEFNIAVNPATGTVYPKEAFELDYEKHYTRAYGVAPDFIKIKDVKPAAIKGQYTMTLEWSDAASGFVKDAAIFIVLNYKDIKGNDTHVVSSTPVIMNEKYVTIQAENVVEAKDIVMFCDETYTDSIRLNNYHPGYVNTIDYVNTAIPVSDPVAINPLTRYLNEADKYKFTVVPFGATNATVWPAGEYVREVNVKYSVADYGRPVVPEIPAKPEIGQPAVPAIPAINSVTIDKNFKVTVYKVPADGIIFTEDFGDRWIPNAAVDYTLSQTLGAEFTKNGYDVTLWNFAIKTQELHTDVSGSWAVTGMDQKVQADVTGFTASNYSVAYKLLPTIPAGGYRMIVTVTATPKTPRPRELSQSREFKVQLEFNVVAPKFQILINDGHTLIGSSSDTYHTYKLADVKVSDLLNVESTKNISKTTDVTPNALPLSYDFDLSDPRHGAQGVRFNPYPAVAAPVVADWIGATMLIKKPITVNVKLATGQVIPVNILCTVNGGFTHAYGTVYVQYDRLNLVSVAAVEETFIGNYNQMLSTGINIARNSNFTPKSGNGTALDPTMIKSIVYSAEGNVQPEVGVLPPGLPDRVLKINPTTGIVNSIDGMTWENPNAVVFQMFRVTYTDIWGNSAFKDVKVSVKSNPIP